MIFFQEWEKAERSVHHAPTPTSIIFSCFYSYLSQRGYDLFWVYLPAVLQAFTSRKQAPDLAHILQWFISLSINHEA